ncbi:polyamine-transporting ATPase 13A2-like [Rhipicephalus sanguineus]|uniref:polyamine-transporting ATPase 13A2-like n=1 Tax=Rhipicephalus sanguineus TaxID=34632 RepID=UPI0020C2E4DE|nr:polyamine-transporting ATPase 13A2-like [Rhipicephalus sanguineus]
MLWDEEVLRGWQPSGWYELLHYCTRWFLPKGWMLYLAASPCPLQRASLEERGLESGQLTCGQLLASTGVHSERRPALLLRHGLNKYTSIVPPPRIPGTRWLAIGAFLWLLRSHYLTAGVAACVVMALWLSQTCECLISKFRRVVQPRSTLALPAAKEIESRLLVPGDVVALKQGDRAPCDLVLLSGDCVVDQGDVALPRMAARWHLEAPERELFSVHKHRTSVILRPSTIVCSRGKLRAVVLRTGAATESAALFSRPGYMYVEEGLGPVQWAVAAVAFLLSLLFWLGRDRFTWDEVLLRALSLHLLLFPPRALLANLLLEKVAASALASAGATSSRGALLSVACWGRANSVAVDCAGCQVDENVAGILPSGCHGFAPVVARGLAQLPQGHPLRWAAAAVGATLWKNGSEAMGHPYEVAAFAAAGSGLKADGYGLDTPPEPAGKPLRLAPFVNPFWSTQRLDEDLRETRDPPDLVSSCIIRVSQSCEPPWTTDEAGLPELCYNDTEPVIEEDQPEDLLRERIECRRLRALACEPRRAGREYCTTVLYETRKHKEVVCIGRPADVFPLCRGNHPAPCNAKAVSASFHERGFGTAAVAGGSCLDANTTREDALNFQGLLLFEPVMNPQAAPAIEELRRIDVRPVVVDEANVYRCIAVARLTGVVLPDEPLLLVCTRNTVFGGPAVDIRILETPSLFELRAPKQEVRRTERLHYALSYRTYLVLRKHFPGLLASVRDTVSVVGGLPASEATAMMRQLGIQTVCAAGSLGLAARHHGAIVVGRAAWPALACDSVADVPRVAMAARYVLGSQSATLDYVALSVCLQACALLVLYAQRATFTDRMHVYLELVACGGPTAALAVSRRFEEQRPQPRQDATAFVLHALCWLAAQVALLGQLHCREWYVRLSERLQRRLDASVLCLLSSYQLPLLALQLATFRDTRPVVVAGVLLPIAVTTALMFPWATSTSLALGLPRWPKDRDTALLRIAIVLAALLNLLVDCLAQLYVAPKFRSEPLQPDATRVPVAATHVGRMPPSVAKQNHRAGQI